MIGAVPDVQADNQWHHAEVDRARAGDGPSVIEMVTWRWFDHYGLAGAKVGVDGAFGLPYRTDDEVKNWISHEPIGRYETWLIERGILTRSELDTIKQQVKVEVDDSVQFARASPLTRPEDGNRNSYKTDIVPATQIYGHPVVT
jgi:pyruvate dehydrogenase E1 component alpha subunit